MLKPDRNGGADTATLVGLMRTRSPLFPLMREFALMPSRYMHASWAEALFTPDLWRRAQQSQRSAPHLDRVILADLGVEGTFPTDFATPAARVTLLDSETLERLLRHLGAAAAGPTIRRVVTNDGVKRLREALGAESYAFAVQRAPLLAPAVSASLPEEDADLDDAAALSDHLRGVGMTILARALAGLPPEVLKRFRLKLRRDDAPDFTASNTSGRAAALVLRVLKETEPRWAFLFATQNT